LSHTSLLGVCPVLSHTGLLGVCPVSHRLLVSVLTLLTPTPGVCSYSTYPQGDQSRFFYSYIHYTLSHGVNSTVTDSACVCPIPVSVGSLVLVLVLIFLS
jgi:hypothetical protein